MILTGKASSYFYSWLHQRFNYEPLLNATSSSQWFNSLHPSMQWGILQDWAYHIGFDLCVFQDINYNQDDNKVFKMFWAVSKIPKLEHDGYCNTLQEARDAAVEKMNEIINNEK